MIRTCAVIGFLYSFLSVAPLWAQSKLPAPKWDIDVSAKPLPAYPLQGKVYGTPFRLDKAEINSVCLKLSQGKDFFPDRAINIFTFKKGIAQNCVITVPFSGEFGSGNPHVHLQYREKMGSNDLPETKIYTNAYSMQLYLGKPQKGYIPGAIYLALPDKSRSYLAGMFMAKIVK